MPIPDYGAAPLAKTFILVRGLSLIAMTAIVGMTANFVAEIVSTNVDPPREVVGTLAITCIAAFYCLISIPFFYARAHLGLIIMAGIDGALLLAFVIVSVVLGEHVSFLDCMDIGSADAAANAQSAVAFAQALASNPTESGGTLGLANWAGSTRTNCLETKATWGLTITLAICFACSSLILPALFFKAKKAAGGGAKSVV